MTEHTPDPEEERFEKLFSERDNKIVCLLLPVDKPFKRVRVLSPYKKSILNTGKQRYLSLSTIVRVCLKNIL